MKNSDFYRSRLTESKFSKIIQCFTNDLTASTTAEITNLNSKTINNIFKLIREIIFTLSFITDKMEGVFELDESYLGAKRVRGTAGKTPVFGVLKGMAMFIFL